MAKRSLMIVERAFFKQLKENDPTLSFIPEKNLACLTVSCPSIVEYTDIETGEVVNSKISLQRYVLLSQKNGTAEDPVLFKPYNSKELLELGLIPKPESFILPPRASPEFLEFINANAKLPFNPTIQEVFQDLDLLLSRFIDFGDERERHLFVIWNIGTYFYRLFESYPYLFITGLKRSGKTKMLRFAQMVAFNAILSANLTSSSLFRLVSDWGATLLMDEEESLNDPNRKLDFRSMLLSGYKRGALVFRTEGEGKKTPTGFEVYSPKALVNISGLEDVLMDRTITIILPRSLNKNILNTNITSEQKCWQEMRDKLIALTLSRWGELYELNKAFEPPEGITGRDLEVWRAMLVIARWVSEELYNEILGLALEKIQEKQVIELNDSRDLLLLNALLLNVKQDDEYSISQIKEWIQGLVTDEELKWLSAQWVGRALRRLGFKNSVKMSKRGGRHYYTIRKEDVIKTALKAGLTIPEDLDTQVSLNLNTPVNQS